MESTNNKESIKFYRQEGKYGFLSNFSRHPITLKGKHWHTVEHYYQAQKFAGTDQEEAIRNTSTPGRAKKMGNDRSSKGGPLRKDWQRVKEKIMYDGLLAKFKQHSNLREQLIATEDAQLVEHTNKDSYWGDGGGSGLNRLGALLMRVRTELKEQPPTSFVSTSKSEGVTQSTDKDSEEEYDQSIEDENGDVEDNDADDDDADDDADDIERNDNTNVPVEGSTSTLPKTVRKAKKKEGRNRMRKNIWKDQTGSSLFAKDNEEKDQVDLVNQGIQIPISALPAEAKFVVHQNQFQRRYRADSDSDEQNLAESEDGDEEEYEPSKHKRTTLGDFLGGNKNNQAEPQAEPVAEYLLSPSKCVSAVVENVSLLQSLSPADPAWNEIVYNLKELRQVLVQFIEQPQDDQMMTHLLAQVEAINEIVT